jgi:hypothetical protein
MRYDRLQPVQQRIFDNLLRAGVADVTMLASKLFPELSAALPRHAEIETEELLEERNAMSTVLTEQDLMELPDDELKTVATQRSISLRGRYSKTSLVARILAQQSSNGSSNGNGKATLTVTPADELDAAEAADRAANENDNEIQEVEVVSEAATSTKKVKDIQHEEMSEEDTAKWQDIIRDVAIEGHPHLVDATFTCFWQYGVKAEADTSRIKIVEIKKANEINRCLGAGDFIVEINYDFRDMKSQQRDGVVDQQLARLKADLDRDGDQKKDSADRNLWRRRALVGIDPEVFARRGPIDQEQLDVLAAARELKVQTSLFEAE